MKHFSSLFSALLLLSSFTVFSQPSWLRHQDLITEANNTRFGWSASMPDSNTVAAGTRMTNDTGFVKVYRRVRGKWVQKGQTIKGLESGDWCGYDVSMPDSNTLAVGSPRFSQIAPTLGHVRVFRWNGNRWVQKGASLSGTQTYTEWGKVVDMPDSNTLAFSAPVGAGRTKIMKWNGIAWVQRGADIIGQSAPNLLGFSISMPDTKMIALGAMGGDYTEVYSWNGVSWNRKGSRLSGSFGDDFGWSVSMADTNHLLVGARDWTSISIRDEGYASFYSWSGTDWVLKGSRIFGDNNGDMFGWAVSMYDSNHFAVGAPQLNYIGNDTGYVKVYEWQGTNWSQIGRNLSAGPSRSFEFGTSVSLIEQNQLAVGAALADQVYYLKFDTCTTNFSVSLNTDTLIASNPNYCYSWIDCSSNQLVSTSNGNSFKPDTTGNYAAVATDGFCYDTSTCFLVDPIYAVLSATDESCLGQGDGSMIANLVSGGTPPYSYNWSNSGSSAQILNLQPGTYTLTITDSNGAIRIESATVGSPAALSSVMQLDSNATCAGSSDGGATAFISGGTKPYTFNWSSTSFSDSILFSASAGAYQLTVTDANGCSLIDSINIGVADSIAPQAIAQNIVAYLDQSGTIQISGQDLDAGSNDNCNIDTLYLYPINSYNCSNVGPNAIELIAVDDNGNRDSIGSTVMVFDTLSPVILINNVNIDLDSSKEASVMASQVDNGTFDNCTMDSIWLGQSSFNCTQIGLNNVWFYALDVNGNIDSAQFTVIVNDTLGADTVKFSISSCDSYFWPQNGQNYTTSGRYSDTLLNRFTCDSVIYNLDLMISRSSNSSQSDSACFSYTWSQNGLTYVNSGFYTDTLSNSSGCDSVITLDLEIQQLDDSVVVVGDSLYAFQENATYLWFDCGGDSVISGAITKGYRPDTTGFYAVIIDNGICIDTSDCKEVIVIGLDYQFAKERSFELYPNPSSEHIFIRLERSQLNKDLIIYDMRGRLMLSKKVTGNKMKVHTAQWDAGIYFLRYGEVTRKLVIAR